MSREISSQEIWDYSVTDLRKMLVLGRATNEILSFDS